MNSFLTRCPHCLTSFRVSGTQLDAAGGMVRCGACLGIFSATSNRITLKQDRPLADTIPAEEELREAVTDDGDTLEEGSLEIGFAVTLDWAGNQPDIVQPPELKSAVMQAQEPEPVAAQSAPAAMDAVLTEDETQAAAASTEPYIDIPLGDLELDDFLDDEDEDDFQDEEEDAESDFEEEENEEAPDEIYDEYYVEDETDAEAFEEDELGEGYPAEDAFEEDFEVDEAEAGLANEAEEDELLALRPVTTYETAGITAGSKAELQQYLADLEDEDALEPLAPVTLDTLADDPVTISAADTTRRRLLTFSLFCLNLLLAGALALQYINANLDRFSRNSRFSPLLPLVCRFLACPEPERSLINSLTSEELLVRSHPRYAQALEVSFIFRNDAPAPQPFPAIELGFSDLNRRPLANRLFQPAEYLPPELQTQQMPAQATLQITLELADPGSAAVNYTLAFREPL
jgi:predicted Zn finger-like uncharacterized protein